jgi:hypothetical protein
LCGQAKKEQSDATTMKKSRHIDLMKIASITIDCGGKCFFQSFKYQSLKKKENKANYKVESLSMNA